MPNQPSKRPHQEVEPTRDAPRTPKRIKTLAQKGEREIHVINSQTTKATNSKTPLPAPSAQDLLEQRPRSTFPASQAPLVLETVEQAAASNLPKTVDPPVISPGGEHAAPVPPAAPVLEVVVERRSPQHPKRRRSVWKMYERSRISIKYVIWHINLMLMPLHCYCRMMPVRGFNWHVALAELDHPSRRYILPNR